MNPIKKLLLCGCLGFASVWAAEDYKTDVSGKVQFRDEYNSTNDTAFNAVKVKGYGEIKGSLGEFFEGGLRLSTYPGTSKKESHVHLNSGFQKIDAAIDRVFINILVNPELILSLGKMGHPFKKSGIYSELAWDNDIQPEGMVLKLDHQTEENDWVKSGGFVAGLYVLDNLAKGKDIPTLSVGQVFLEMPLKKIALINLSSAGYFYFHPQTPEGDNNGMEYHILQHYINAKFISASVPWELKFTNFYNYMTDRDNLGYVLGAGVGRKKKLGDVYAFLQAQYIGQRAVNPAFAQNDFGLSSGFWGYMLGMKITLDPKVKMGIRLLSTNPQRETNWHFKARMDLTAGF